jgi:pyrroline-5-carboxylate reductase
VIGAGAMGGAMVTGFVRTGLVAAADIMISDRNQQTLSALGEQLGVATTEDNRQAAGAAEIIICAVKPKQVKEVLEEIASLMTPEHLLISVAAGISTAFLEANLPPGVPVIRAMPNLPVLVGAGMTALALGACASDRDREDAESCFQAVGRAVTLPEANIDAATGVSGSSPAFLAVILEALADSGVLLGLSRQVALELASQAMLGTARLIQDSGLHPAVLKDRVSSPAGTTIAGLQVLEENGVRGILIDAVEAAAKRAAELSK